MLYTIKIRGDESSFITIEAIEDAIRDTLADINPNMYVEIKTTVKRGYRNG